MPTLKFVIDCSVTPGWNLSPGEVVPADRGPIYEARCIPGGLIGCGRKPQEALENLRRLLVWTLNEEPSPDAWYRTAWERAPRGDIKTFGSSMVDSARRLRSERRESADGVDYSLETALSC
jgi:hypothetical protein